MSLRRLVLRRIVVGVLAIWAVLSVVFAMFTMTRDYRLGSLLASASRGPDYDPEEIAEVREQYLAERGLDRPVHEQYVDWMTDMFTLQWGESYHTGAEAFPTVMRATLRTASYVIPALGLALLVGLLVGVAVATTDRSIGDGTARGATYLTFGLPNFWIAVMAVSAIGAVALRFQPAFSNRRNPPTIESYSLPFAYEYVLPTLLVASTLVAGMVSYSRAYSLQYVSTDRAKQIRAKGGGRLAVARHVLRNAAIPLVSLAFAETLALLAIAVFVLESLFGIEGLGLLFYNAVWTRDLPVLMGGTMVIVAVGVTGNVLQDLAYSALDPRVDTGAR